MRRAVVNFRGEFITMIKGRGEEKNRNESVNDVNLESDLLVKTGVLFGNRIVFVVRWEVAL